MEIGYTLICEEHPPARLLKNAAKAEEAGFNFLAVSDHFHPWTSTQGESPFVWSVLGALSVVTQEIKVSTAVTCPTYRYHPAVVAQAAATSAKMLEGRFSFGVGSGEALNESIMGLPWPEAPERLARLKEAVHLIRELWTGENVTFRGEYYKAINARIFTLPDTLPPICVAASGDRAAELAGEIGDGFWGLEPDAKLIKTYLSSGGKKENIYGQFHVCCSESKEASRKMVHERWPNHGLKGEMNVILPTVNHFEQACEMVTEEMACENVPVSKDPQDHIEQIKKYQDAGYTHVTIHQIGTDHSYFFDLYKAEVLPEFR